MSREPFDASTLCKCEVCGSLPADSHPVFQPKLHVAQYAYGEPWLYAVTCQVCGGQARATSQQAAIDNWQTGRFAGIVDLASTKPSIEMLAGIDSLPTGAR